MSAKGVLMPPNSRLLADVFRASLRAAHHAPKPGR